MHVFVCPHLWCVHVCVCCDMAGACVGRYVCGVCVCAHVVCVCNVVCGEVCVWSVCILWCVSVHVCVYVVCMWYGVCVCVCVCVWCVAHVYMVIKAKNAVLTVKKVNQQNLTVTR